MTQFKTLELQGIEEGQFLELANQDLRTVEEKLIEFVRLYGERAEGAKATLTISITLSCMDVKSRAFGIKAATAMKMPNRPASLTMGLGGQDEVDGRPVLFVRKTGSDSSSPAQGKLCNNRGETIDPDTGEVIPDGKSRAAGER